MTNEILAIETKKSPIACRFQWSNSFNEGNSPGGGTVSHSRVKTTAVSHISMVVLQRFVQQVRG